MARKQARPLATKHATLDLLEKSCRACGHRLLMARHSHRKVTRLDGVYDLRIKVYQCLNRECPRLRQVCRPEEEGSWALPHGEFGLDVIALVGALRYREQRSIPQIHQELLRRGLQVAQRSVTDQLYRYEELLAVSLAERKRLKERLKGQKHVILALDGLQPDVGQEVLWLLRDCWAARGALSTQPAGSHRRGFSPAVARSRQHLPRPRDPHCRSDHRWSTLHPQCGRQRFAKRRPPALSFSLSPRSSQAHL